MEDRPLIVQTDKTLLLEVDSPAFDECRNAIIPFCELIKSPEHIHTYKLSPISIWNACSAGLDAASITDALVKYSRYSVPQIVTLYIKETADRYGRIVMEEDPESDGEYCRLHISDERLYTIITSDSRVKPLIAFKTCDKENGVYSVGVGAKNRGNIKSALIKTGWPVEDRVPLKISKTFPVKLKDEVKLRDYQKEAVNSLLGDGKPGTGYGTVVLPCGSGKTVVGLAVMEKLSTPTLVICPNVVAVRQWIDEILSKTETAPENVAEYSGERKKIADITVCTYQVLSYHDKDEVMNNFDVMKAKPWGLLIFDEVHLLPAPVFRLTAALQSVYRLGMTATLIREDGLETDVFSLIGPKRYDVPWNELQDKGWIAEAVCTEIRIPLPEEDAIRYATGTRFEQNRIAAVNPDKAGVVKELLKRHEGEFILVIGQYLDQLKAIAEQIGAPLITGSMPNGRRRELFDAFKKGETKVLVVSRVANFAIDLPDASVAIQVSGIFGSRQEEAQRLGRILRPKEGTSHFYSIITKFTAEEDFAANRQKFLIEQGYSYETEER